MIDSLESIDSQLKESKVVGYDIVFLIADKISQRVEKKHTTYIGQLSKQNMVYHYLPASSGPSCIARYQQQLHAKSVELVLYEASVQALWQTIYIFYCPRQWLFFQSLPPLDIYK